MYLIKGYKNIWYIKYINPTTQKFTQISTKTKVKSDANKKLLEYKKRMFLPDEFQKEKDLKLFTLKQLFDKNIEVDKQQNPKVVFNECVPLLKHFIASLNQFSPSKVLIEDIPLHQITSLNIENYKSYRTNTGVSNGTINKDLRILKAIFNKGILWGMTTHNPVKGVKKYDIPQKQIYTITETEFDLIISKTENKNLIPIFRFAFYTGCRLQEYLNLEWSDVDFKNELIHIRNKVGFTTKTKKNRVIPFNKKIKELLFELRQNELSPKGYLFKKIDNNYKYCRNYISKKFKEYLLSAGLSNDLHLHNLRHSFATNMVRKRGIVITKQLLGHTSINTTMIYTHLNNQDLKEAMEQVG